MKDRSDLNSADQTLVGRVLGGDPNAFSIIISNTERLVAQIVFKMIPNSEDKKDIAQDIYLKTFQKLGTFKFQSKLSTWIGQIAYNTCLNYLEAKKIILFHDSTNENERNNKQIEQTIANDDYSETENVFLRSELKTILKIETDKLSPLYKTLITLYHNEELSYIEIAQITELPEGTVKSYLYRARKCLKDNLLRNYKKDEL